MRTLDCKEINTVGGAGWEVSIDLGPVEIKFDGEETVQQMWGGLVGGMTDFFTWWDPGAYYGACSGGGGR